VRGLRHGSTHLLAGKVFQCPFNERFGELQSRSGSFGEEKYLALNEIQTPDRLAHRLVAVGYFRTDNKTKKQRDEMKC